MLNPVEFKMVVNLLLTTSWRGALSLLRFTSLAMIATLTLEKFNFFFFQSNPLIL